jgi:hypothetical protein
MLLMGAGTTACWSPLVVVVRLVIEVQFVPTKSALAAKARPGVEIGQERST